MTSHSELTPSMSAVLRQPDAGRRAKPAPASPADTLALAGTAAMSVSGSRLACRSVCRPHNVNDPGCCRGRSDLMSARAAHDARSAA